MATPSKYFNILALDGGGIQGLYSARVLEQIENRFQAKLVDHFDLICGTSTGGLIALALSFNHSASEIADFYTEKGGHIFPPKKLFGNLFSTLKQGVFSNKYKAEKLKTELINFFGETLCLKDAKSLLCIPAFNISQGKPIVFKYPHKEGHFFRDANLKVTDVALATSAAPTYFPNHSIHDPNLRDSWFTDGGVWCNNPALCGLIEAWRFFVGPEKEFDAIRLISIGTISKPSGEQFQGGSFLKWNKKLIGTALQGQSYFTNHFLEQINHATHFPVEYLRIEPSNISAKQHKLLGMDMASPKSIQLLNQLGTSSGVDFVTQRYDWLSPIFSSVKIYSF